jgi:hypothetical protein
MNDGSNLFDDGNNLFNEGNVLIYDSVCLISPLIKFPDGTKNCILY